MSVAATTSIKGRALFWSVADDVTVQVFFKVKLNGFEKDNCTAFVIIIQVIIFFVGIVLIEQYINLLFD